VEKYIVCSSVGLKRVTVRIGSKAASEHRTFGRGETFETTPEFVTALLAMGYVEKQAKPPAAKPAAKPVAIQKDGETK
jgi:hypothetical protein